MTFLGVVGILLGLLGGLFAFAKVTRVKLAIFSLSYLVHLAATVAYYLFSLSNVTDAHGYYYDLYYFMDHGFGLSTQFVFFLVQTGRGWFGGTYLDYFFIFQVPGFYGICLLMRIFEDIYRELEVQQPLYINLLLFIPGLHFWTSFIGKDAPLFLGSCLAVWSAMNIRRRYVGMGCAIGIMLLFRPHIAVLAAAALALMLFLDRSLRWRIRLPLLAAALLGLGGTAGAMSGAFGLDVTDADALSDFLASQSEIAYTEDAGNTVVQGSYWFRLISLLARPLFIDAEGAMGYVVSSENLLFLILLLSIILRFPDVIRMARRAAFIRFSLAFAIILAALLALVYYNIGLGLRQRTMFIPEVLAIFVALDALRRARHAAKVRESVGWTSFNQEQAVAS